MDTLSPELLDLISDKCDHPSLKSLRCVCKQFRDLTTAAVFEHFYMGLFSDSLDKLRQLAKSPRLAKHVKSFTFCADMLPEYQDDEDGRGDWEHNIQFFSDAFWTGKPLAECKSQPVPPLTASQLDDGWYNFQQLRKDQRSWRADRESLLFKEYFAMLPNVVEAKFVTAELSDGRTSTWPFWKRLRNRIFVTPEAWRPTKEVPLAAAESSRLSGLASLCLLEAIGFRASFAGTMPIPKLTLHLAYPVCLKSLMFDETGHILVSQAPPAIATRWQLIRDCFRDLTDLSVRLTYVININNSLGATKAEELLDWLHCSRDLRRLDLLYRDDYPGMAFESALAGLPDSDSVFSHLEHLGLAGNVRYARLNPLLRSIAPTLRSLELRNLYVSELDTFMTEIPEILALERIYLENVWHAGRMPNTYARSFQKGSNLDEPHERAVKAYLLGGSGGLPQLQSEDGYEQLEIDDA